MLVLTCGLKTVTVMSRCNDTPLLYFTCMTFTHTGCSAQTRFSGGVKFLFKGTLWSLLVNKDSYVYIQNLLHKFIRFCILEVDTLVKRLPIFQTMSKSSAWTFSVGLLPIAPQHHRKLENSSPSFVCTFTPCYHCRDPDVRLRCLSTDSVCKRQRERLTASSELP